MRNVKIPAGDIAPCRFVKAFGGPGHVSQAGANDDICGVSSPQPRNMFGGGVKDRLAGMLGDDEMEVLGPNDRSALLELGGPVQPGQPLKSDADGKGVVATEDKDNVGAVSEGRGSVGELIKVRPTRYVLRV